MLFNQFSLSFLNYPGWLSQHGHYKKYCLLGLNLLQSIESWLPLSRNMWPLSSASKNKPGMKPMWKQVAPEYRIATMPHAGLLRRLSSIPEDYNFACGSV
jgi:hypothetical protein